MDSLKQQTTDHKAIKDESLSDSISVFPSMFHGALHTFVKPYLSISKSDLKNINYSGLSDIINYTLPTFSRDLGYFGQYNNFSYLGSIKSNNLLFNGVSLATPLFGTSNFTMYSPEIIENIEMLVGSNAALLSNSSDLLMNLQEVRYNTKATYSRVWFEQAASDYIALDGLISQNIDSTSNFYFGFKTQNSSGYFPNSFVHSWNIRSAYRINFDSLSSLSISYLFNNHGIGLNGGVNKNASLTGYDNIGAVVNFNDLNERIFRNGITITYSNLKDKSFSYSTNLFYTHNDIDRQFPPALLDSNGGRASVSGYELGGKQTIVSKINTDIYLTTGAEISFVNNDSTFFIKDINEVRYALFSQVGYSITENLIFSPSIRFFKEFSQNLNFGANFNYTINQEYGSKNEVILDYSKSQKSNDRYTFAINELEKTDLFFLEYRHQESNINYKFNIYYRQNLNVVVLDYNYTSGNLFFSRYLDQNLFGGFLQIHSLISKDLFMSNDGLSIEFKINSQVDKNEKLLLPQFQKLFPLFSLSFTPIYQMKVNESVVKFGVNFILTGAKAGVSESPLTHSLLENSISEGITNNGVDLFLNAKLGNAIIKATFYNLLDSPYFNVPFYPNIGRNLRISLFWSFFD